MRTVASLVTALTTSTLLATAMTTAGCAHYRPYSAWNDGGYSDQEVSVNRFRVRFVGNEQMPPATAEDLAMLRAAELCTARQMPFVELSDISSSVLESGMPQYVEWQSAQSRALQAIVPWPTKTVYTSADGPGRAREAVPVTRHGTPITDLTATCVGESRDGVEDAAELVKELRALYAKRIH